MSFAAAFVIDDASELGRSAHTLLRGAGLAETLADAEPSAPRVLLVDASDEVVRAAIRRKPSRVVHVMQALPLPGEVALAAIPGVGVRTLTATLTVTGGPPTWGALQVRAAPYLEGLLPRLALALASGRFLSAAPDGEAAYVAHEDAAMLAATLLASDIHEPDPLFMTGPTSFSHRSLCRLVSELFAREVRVEPVPFEALPRALSQGGLSPEQAALSLRTDQLLASDACSAPSSAGPRITGMAPLALPAFLARVRERLDAAVRQGHVSPSQLPRAAHGEGLSAYR
jgi:NAD(P)H dehydrogenase (quinone)